MTARYPNLTHEVPLQAGWLQPGVSFRDAARNYLEIEPNHVTLHLSLNITASSLVQPTSIIPSGTIPLDLRPVDTVHMSIATSSGGTFVAFINNGGVSISSGSPVLAEHSWVIGSIRAKRRAA